MADRDGVLLGRRIVVTRARTQAAELADPLRALGADVVCLPMIRIVPPVDASPLFSAARRVKDFDWVVFTSANAVEAFWSKVVESGTEGDLLAGPRTCAIGPGTASALRQRGVTVELMADIFVGEAVAQGLIRAGAGKGTRVLLPRAEHARPQLPALLREAGAELEEVIAYRIVPEDDVAGGVRDEVTRGEIDAITFTSGSTARRWVELVGSEVGSALIVSIGPVTTRVLEDLGLQVDLEARNYSISGLVKALVQRFGEPT